MDKIQLFQFQNSPYQTFPGIQSIKTIGAIFIPKIKKIHSGVWKYNGQKPSKLSNLVKYWPSLNFSGIYTIIFPKKTTRAVSTLEIIKVYSGVWKMQFENTQKCLFWPKMANFRPCNFGGQNIFRPKICWSPMSYETKLYAKKTKTNNIERSRLQGRNGRTNVRTRVNLQVPIRTSQENQQNLTSAQC